MIFMRISDLIKMGLRNLNRRKARTALTVVGVVIGTISIVVMISIGIGMNASYKAQVMELGSLTTITVNKHAAVFDDKGNYVDSKEQKMDDAFVDSIAAMDHVKMVTPVIAKSAILTTGKYQAWAQVYAMNWEAFKAFDFPELTYGSYPTAEGSEAVILGFYTLQNFYNPSGRGMSSNYTPDPAKDKLIMSFDAWEYQRNPKKKEKKILLTDVAVMEQSNNENDYYIYMDINTFKKHYMQYIRTLKVEDRKTAERALSNYEQIKISVDNVKNVVGVQDKIKELGYSAESLGSTLETMENTSKMLQMVLGGVGAIAMLVSAISIANTMVMSIYERTKEIGVMKVLGCIITDIKKLFLFEAAMIGLIGGIIGIALSYLASYAINTYGAPLFETLLGSNPNMGGGMGDMGGMGEAVVEIQTKFSMIPLWLPILAAGFAMSVGIISGYFPAQRATKISAIEAMKTEG